MKDLNFENDPRVLALPPALRPKMVSQLSEAAAAELWDVLSVELKDAFEARTVVPTVVNEMSALRRVMERPQVVEAVIKEPAKPKAVQKAPRLLDCLVASATAEFLRRTNGTPVGKTIDSLFDAKNHKLSRSVSKKMLRKSATGPARTLDAAWASELTNHDVLGFWQDVGEVSVLGSLVSRGFATPLDFGPNNSLTVPLRGPKGTMRGAWVEEGATIPMLQGSLGSATFFRYKLAGISAYSDELAQVSVPSIQSTIREFILEDTLVAADEAFLSTDGPVPALRPGGILTGVTPLTPGAGYDDDLKGLLGAMATARARNPVFLISPQTELALMLARENGQYIFHDAMLNEGTIYGRPYIVSNNVPETRIIILDAAALAIALAVPEIDQSNAATLVMTDAAGADPKMQGNGADHGSDAAGDIQISDAATTVPASEVKSMFQMSATAIRVVYSGMSWGMMAPSYVAYVDRGWS
ncbi:phage major capsid protein [Ruegeria sp. HKCCD7318]|uniref:phage major capsid protein n=1 Tax=Ruegeria sp. HKCCD7318 TaxID=2683014 RepID=UPI001491140B|nr:phage major capsid protein [Ruegeria sp. HKCCD7318]NOE32504.1 phage major capsid protein [Ruegeria sp. HKCCD7318]